MSADPAHRPDPPAARVLIYAWCGPCARQSRMLTARRAAEHCGVTAPTVRRWAAAGRVHSVRTAEGALLVCYASLFC